MELQKNTNVSWYNEKIEVIPQETRHILERYSGVASDKVVDHVEKVRSEAFAVVPYPCIGQGKFLDVNMSKNPQYTEVLSRVKAGEKIVDVGCCFGTDLRKLIVDGASPHNVFGIDLEQEFFDHGFALYRDETKFPNECCIAENMLEQQLSPGLKRLEGQIDIAYMSSFLHVFDIHEQLMAMRKVLKLLRKKPGSLIIGRQIGNVNAGSYKKRMVKYESASYYHNVSSFEAFMNLLGAETNTEWEVDATIDEEDYAPRVAEEDLEKKYPWLYPNTRRLMFSARMKSTDNAGDRTHGI